MPAYQNLEMRPDETIRWEVNVPRFALLRREGITLLGILAVLIIAMFLTPDPKGYGTHQQLRLPPCSFKFVTGRPCPACGLTTCFTAMAHLQIGAAFHAHPLGIILFLAMVGYGALLVYTLITRRRLVVPYLILTRFTLPFVLVFCLYGFIRLLFWKG